MEGAIDQGAAAFALATDRLVEGRQEAEIDIHRLEGAGVGAADVTDE